MKRMGIALAACIGISLASVWTPAGEKGKPHQTTPEEVKLFELTNQERKKNDVPVLILSPALSKIARAHSENMARQGKMEHTLDGKKSKDRVDEAGYKFRKVGENIAFGEKGAASETIMQAWMESKDHRANLLLAEFTEIGIGIARDKNGQIYYTQLFARPRK